MGLDGMGFLVPSFLGDEQPLICRVRAKNFDSGALRKIQAKLQAPSLRA